MQFSIHGEVKRFPGKSGWWYVPLDDKVSEDLRPMLKNVWPALLRADFTLENTKWQSSIMPIKDGPLFIALPARVRKEHPVAVGDAVVIEVELMA